MSGGRDLSRELLSLSRQGGIPARERLRPKKQNQTLGKSQSVPSLSQTTKTSGQGGSSRRPSKSTRMGGGWSTDTAPSGLANIKAKVEQAVERGASLDYCEAPFYRTALWEATWRNHLDIVKLLATKGATVSAADYQGRTPLHEAAFYGHAGVVDLLLDTGHPLECEDVFGQTPLFRAVEAGRPEVVRLLLERGADTNRLDRDSVTVQHVAAFKGMPVFSRELLCKGAVKNRFAITEHADIIRAPLRVGGSLVLGERTEQ